MTSLYHIRLWRFVFSMQKTQRVWNKSFNFWHAEFDVCKAISPILFFLTRIRPCSLKLHERSFSSSRGQGYRLFISLWPLKNVADLAVGSTGQEICCDSSISSLSTTLCSWLALSLPIENFTGQILTNDPYMSAEGLSAVLLGVPLGCQRTWWQ